MIIDTSVVVAVLRGEPEAPAYIQAIEDAATCRMSAANYVEAAIVVDGNRDPILSRRLDELIHKAAIVIEVVTPGQAQIAREAYRDYGRESGHPARLNFGDCFAYALAKDMGEPLLFKGDDFVHTDIAVAK